MFVADSFDKYLSAQIDSQGRRYIGSSDFLRVIDQYLFNKNTAATEFGRQYHAICEYELTGKPYYLMTKEDARKNKESIIPVYPQILLPPADYKKMKNMVAASQCIYDEMDRHGPLVLEQSLYVEKEKVADYEYADEADILRHLMLEMPNSYKVRVDAYSPSARVLWDFKSVTASTWGKVRSEIHYRMYWVKMAFYALCMQASGYPVDYMVLNMIVKSDTHKKAVIVNATISDLGGYLKRVLPAKKRFRELLDNYKKYNKLTVECRKFGFKDFS